MNVTRTFLTLALVIGSVGTASADFNYADFNSVDGLKFFEAAFQHGSIARLNPSAFSKRGKMFFTKQQRVDSGFRSVFKFRISEILNRGSDGVFFWVQKDAPPTLGKQPYFHIFIDTYHAPDDNYLHVRLDTKSIDTHFFQGVLPINASDGNVHTVDVNYDGIGKRLTITFDNADSPFVDVAADLSPLELDGGMAWVALHAGTGAEREAHDIHSWSFKSTPEPPALALAPVAFAQQDGPKHPIPDEAAQESTRQLIQEIYADELRAAKTSEQKLQLAQKLMKVAKESTSDPAGQFVLLAKVREMAAEMGNVQLVLTTIDEVSKTFAIESLAWTIESLTLIERGRTLKTSEQRRLLADAVLSLVEQAIAEDQFDNASKLAAIVSRVAKSGKDLTLARQAAQRQKEVKTLQVEFKQVQEAKATLNVSPIDAEANLAVGRYYCFSKADWDVGLLMLALGSDARLKKLAEQELQRPESTSEQMKIADAWWEFAKEIEGRQQQMIQMHAATWYRNALPKLTGLHKAKAEKRLQGLPSRSLPRQSSRRLPAAKHTSSSQREPERKKTDRIRTLSSLEQKAIEEAERTSRPLTNGDFTKNLEGWNIEGGAAAFRTVRRGDARLLTTLG